MPDPGFSKRVYALVAAVPPGRVVTYGQLARLAEHPRGARIVGYFMCRCPDRAIPCHRVVHRDGGLCPRPDAFGAPGLQRRLLEDEGVVFLPDGRVDLARCQWMGP